MTPDEFNNWRNSASYTNGEVFYNGTWRQLDEGEKRTLERYYLEKQLRKQMEEWENRVNNMTQAESPVVKRVRKQFPKKAVAVFHDSSVVMEFIFPDEKHPEEFSYGPFKFEHVGRDARGRSLYIEVETDG